MRKRLLPIFLILGFIIAGVPYSFAEEKIIICGTGDSQELLRVLAAEFEKQNPGIQVIVPEALLKRIFLTSKQ